MTMFPEPVSDGTFVAAVLAGNSDAFEQLVKRYQSTLLRVARSRMRAYFVHRLLEIGGMPEAEAPAYLERVPCYAETRARYAPDREPDAYWGAFLAEMLAKGILRRVDGGLYAREFSDAGAGVKPESSRSVG